MPNLLSKRKQRRTLLLLASLLSTITLYLTMHRPVHRAIPDIFSHYSAEHLTGDGYIAAEGPASLCHAYSWKPFRSSPKQPRKVYDLLLLNTEIDMLTLRLHTLDPVVDYFVIVESPQTFTGLEKPLYLHQMPDLHKFAHKIIHHVLDPDVVNSTRTWDHEDAQRNAMYTAVFPYLTGPQAPHKGDVLLVSDVDEIPRPATVALLKACNIPKRITLRSRFYYYGFQFLHRGEEWPHPQATTYDPRAPILPADLRNGEGGSRLSRVGQTAEIANAAWHCSSCFRTIAEFLRKMESFSHTAYNHAVFRNTSRIINRVSNGTDLWDRKGEEYDFVEDNEDVPRYVMEHRKEWRWILEREVENAGFEDVQIWEGQPVIVERPQDVVLGVSGPEQAESGEGGGEDGGEGDAQAEQQGQS
jgi:beta-1,4-mannosyl-glycoprotein beta-1,4-N-acetylglucosaminyltransferase